MSELRPTDDWTLGQVKEWLRERLEDGESCPTCTQHAKVYKRRINAGMVQALIVMHREAGAEWFNLPDLSKKWRSRDEAMLRYWSLIEEATAERQENGAKAGMWRVTYEGRMFLGGAPVPKYARIYNGRLLGLTGEGWTAQEALGEAFDLWELLRA